MAYTRPMILDPGDLPEGVYADSGWRLEEGLPDETEETPVLTGGEVLCELGETTMWNDTDGQMQYNIELVGYTGGPVTVYLSFDNMVNSCWGGSGYLDNQMPGTQAVLKFWETPAYVTVYAETSVGTVNITEAHYEYEY